MRICYIFVLLALLLAACSRTEPTDPEVTPRKNIVFILTDDQGPWALGAYDPASNASTPNLDQFATSAAYLPQSFVVTPVCSPSRASLATSLYGTEVGITDWINTDVEPELGLDPETVTWYELLQDAGYHTALIGKWHLGVLDRYHPTRSGFAYFMGHRGGGWSPVDPVLEINGDDERISGLSTDILTDEAIRFVEQAPGDQPFLLALHYRAPHAKWLPVAPEDWAPFENLQPQLPRGDYPGLDTERARRYTREYLASVRGIDRNIGRLLRTLSENGLDDSTIVIFTSDHGYNIAHHGIAFKGNGQWLLHDEALPPGSDNIPRGQRPNMFDTSIKTPTIVRWPGVTTPGSRIESSVTNLDWFPTLVAVAGATASPTQVIRGRDLAPLLSGNDKAWNNDVFAQYSARHESHSDMRTYRTPEWKLTRDFTNPGRDELYHIGDDPDEMHNLIDVPEYEAIVADLHDRMLQEMRAIDDPMLNVAAAK